MATVRKGDDPVMDDVEKTLAREYPQWHFWWSRDSGGEPSELMATRRRNLTADEIEDGLAPTLPMGFGGDLREQLAEQTRRERALGQGM